MSNAKSVVQQLLALADISIGGPKPYDIQVHDERFYKRVLDDRVLGIGESYMDGWWSVKRLDQLVARALSAGIKDKFRINPKLVSAIALSILRNRQSIKRSQTNASHHYDIGNDLYKLMLGKRMIYSCGYWKNSRTLDQAQEAKLDLVCRKLQLKPGMTLLDIGCGWGGFAEYASSKYKVHVTGITPAKEQVVLAKKRTAGLAVKIQQKDYRQVSGSYDRIVSVGMLEHVGPKNYKQFFRQCKALLNDGGIMLHHTIGNNRPVYSTDPWIEKYIFPGGVLPSLSQISKAVERGLVIEDVQNLGPDYDKTLLAWHANFVKHYPKLKEKYDKKFYRMWEFYLLMSAGSFRARNIQLWQIVMRKIEPSETYNAPR